LNNRLVGFQIGGRRDTWSWGNRISFQSFINGGVYSNQFRHDDVSRTSTTVITGDDINTAGNEFSQTTTSVETRNRFNLAEVAFVGEAGITSTLRISECVALRGGYQVLVIDGVGQGLDAYLSPGLSADTLVYHGLQFGLEYRR